MIKNSIEEDIERLKLCSTNQCNICGRYEKEECMLERNRCEQHILSDYKRVLERNEVLLKENEQLNKKVDLMENYMVENGWEICFDNIYAELNNCNGMEKDWCRGDKLEKQDMHKYFSKNFWKVRNK